MLTTEQRQSESERLKLWGWREWSVPQGGNYWRCYHCRRWFPRKNMIDFGTGFEGSFHLVDVCPQCVIEQLHVQLKEMDRFFARDEIDRNDPKFNPEPPKKRGKKK